MIYESDIESYLIRQVESIGGQCIKLGLDGWPDRIAILPHGKLIWIELKREDGKLSTIQKWRREVLLRLGQRVEVPFSKADVDAILRE